MKQSKRQNDERTADAARKRGVEEEAASAPGHGREEPFRAWRRWSQLRSIVLHKEHGVPDGQLSIVYQMGQVAPLPPSTEICLPESPNNDREEKGAARGLGCRLYVQAKHETRP